MSAISKRIVRELRDKEFRDEYVASRVKRYIATQIKAMRTQGEREWSQGDLADKLGTAQSNISRIENPDYGKFTLQTLLEISEAFDVALQVRFVDHLSFLTSTSDMSPDRMAVQSYGPKMEALMGRVFGITVPPSIQYSVSTSGSATSELTGGSGYPEIPQITVGSNNSILKITVPARAELAQ